MPSTAARRPPRKSTASTVLATAATVTIATLGVGPLTPHASAANVLTITGYTAGGVLRWDMDKMLKGAYCSEQSGNVCNPVNYAAGLGTLGELDGLLALTSALDRTSPPTIVMAFSQGATVASHWLRTTAGRADAPAPEDLSLVLLANPWRKYGGSNAQSLPTASTPGSQYAVTDIAVEYDGAADYPDNPLNLLAVANAAAGFQYIHIPGYDDVDLENTEKLTWVEGNTTYILIRRENIPLLEPLRLVGLGALADELNGPLKAIIDTAYNRNYPGIVSDAEAEAEPEPETEQAAAARSVDDDNLRHITDEGVDTASDTKTSDTETSDTTPAEVEETATGLRRSGADTTTTAAADAGNEVAGERRSRRSASEPDDPRPTSKTRNSERVQRDVQSADQATGNDSSSTSAADSGKDE